LGSHAASPGFPSFAARATAVSRHSRLMVEVGYRPGTAFRMECSTVSCSAKAAGQADRSICQVFGPKQSKLRSTNQANRPRAVRAHNFRTDKLLKMAPPYSSQCELPLYALRPRGPRKNQRIKPSNGSSTTTSIQSSFFSLEAELWKIFMIAQISPASMSRPKMPLYPKFITVVPFLFRRSCPSLM